MFEMNLMTLLGVGLILLFLADLVRDLILMWTDGRDRKKKP